MSVNTAHANNGVLIHYGEYILLYSDNVSMEFSGQDNSLFRGTKYGRIYLTSHRIIFNNRKSGDEMQSFSAPFIAMSDVDLEQPVFGANFIKGKVRAQANGNFIGEVKFKLYFKSGGAIEYGMALLRAARTAQSNLQHAGNSMSDNPPPYTPSNNWYEAPTAAYQIPSGYYGWLPQHEAFTGPEPNSVFMSDSPPPYPGIGAPPAYTPTAGQTPLSPSRHPYNPTQTMAYNPSQENMGNWNMVNRGEPQQNVSAPMLNQQQSQEEMPSWNGFSLPPPNEEQFRQQQQQPQMAAYPNPSQNPWAGVHPQNAFPFYPPNPGYPNQPNAAAPPPYPPYPTHNTPGYNMGFNNAPSNCKELETASGGGDASPQQNGSSSDVPPAYEDLPPPDYQRTDGPPKAL